jgi:small subunit ribosomal protein S13
MIYILETKLRDNSFICFALRNIYGIGKKNSFFICKKLGFSNNFLVSKLSSDQVLKIIRCIEKSKILIGNNLRKFQSSLLMDIINLKVYKGLRRLKGLPVRGQRTHTNSKTSKRLKVKL